MAWIEIFQGMVCLLVIVSSLLCLISAVGLCRFSDFYSRLHAPTIAATTGLVGILLASVLMSVLNDKFSAIEFLMIAFVFVTSPVSANLMAQAAMHLNGKVKF